MYYLNTGEQMRLFQMTANSEIFVDKSLLIEKISEVIGKGCQYICITRPRRFGKTMNANMLGAYYTKGYDSHPFFDKLAVAGTREYEKHMNQYNVIHIDFSRQPDLCETYEDYIRDIIETLKEDLREAYPRLGSREYKSISRMLSDTQDTFIFILDEWDSVFYESFMTNSDRSSFLKFLKGLLKDRSYVELAYMTGVLPIAKYSSGSELNMFDEYDFMNDNIYDAYFGFSEEEVRQLCSRNQGVSYEEMKQWYDGYYTSDGKSLFNPRSVSKALMRGVCLNYWTETGPMNEIAECIEHNVDEVREDIVKLVSGIPVEAELNGYSAAEQQLDTRDEILSAMVVYGFLSYYDGYLKIPNHELMEKFQKVLARNSMGEVKEIVESSKSMLEATLAGDEKKVAEILESVHDREIPFLEYNDENALSCVITLCYLYARKDYRIEREEKSGKGYCDYLFYPKKSGKTAIVLELKVDKKAEDAIKQIKEKNYVQKVKNCASVLMVGIAYDKAKKKHQCVIERYKYGSDGVFG
jgi:hypothetical protein